MRELLSFTTSSGAKEIPIIETVTPCWKKLGIALNFEDYVLRTIKKDNPNDSEACCHDLLGRWLQGSGSPVTWKTLLLAMVQAKCTKIAKQVWKELSGEGTSVS